MKKYRMGKVALHHSEVDSPSVPLQGRCSDRGRQGRRFAPGRKSQPLPPLSPAIRAQQQLGTLINLSEGGDLFICKGPG